jgi:hypothetical protein
LIEAILSESRRVLRYRPGVLVVEHRLGFVVANAGVDQSNVDPAKDREPILLLPKDPDASARRLHGLLLQRFGRAVGVIINDSFGRACRSTKRPSPTKSPPRRCSWGRRMKPPRSSCCAESMARRRIAGRRASAQAGRRRPCRSAFPRNHMAVRILPMSGDPVRTRVHTGDGWLEFQRYFVQQECRPEVRGFLFAGAEAALAHADFLAHLKHPALRAVIICPSNPFISIGPILALPGIPEALRDCSAPVVAVAPVVGGKAVKGPTAKMMRELGPEVSAATVADQYRDFLDGYHADAAAGLPIPTVATRALMVSLADRENLTRTALELADRFSNEHG